RMKKGGDELQGTQATLEIASAIEMRLALRRIPKALQAANMNVMARLYEPVSGTLLERIFGACSVTQSVMWKAYKELFPELGKMLPACVLQAGLDLRSLLPDPKLPPL
ncbi:hypothetical protein GOP47_0030566, partial [Adiantum capillus-veneris]